jgi:hypothetical protein
MGAGRAAARSPGASSCKCTLVFHCLVKWRMLRVPHCTRREFRDAREFRDEPLGFPVQRRIVCLWLCVYDAVAILIQH